MRIAFPSLFAVPLFAACVAPTPGNVRQVPDPVSTRYINPGTLAALPGFTHAVRVGSTLYISGEVALDSTGKLVGPGDLGAQARQAFRQPRVRPQDRRSDARRRREADDLRGELFPARLRGHP